MAELRFAVHRIRRVRAELNTANAREARLDDALARLEMNPDSKLRRDSFRVAMASLSKSRRADLISALQ